MSNSCENASNNEENGLKNPLGNCHQLTMRKLHIQKKRSVLGSSRLSQPHHRLRAWFLVRLLGLGVVGLPLAQAQISIDDVVYDFELPRFNDETGLIDWRLEGKEGVYRSEHEIEISDMTLTVYRHDDEGNPRPETRIMSPKATMHLRESKATGPGVIRIIGREHQITGRQWTWNGQTSRITIEKDARVIFRDTVFSILK